MSPEQQLIQQIQQVLQASQLERNGTLEDLAVQFVELCEMANSRLNRCADYLDKGMRSEAVNESHNSPDLLQLANLLQFEGFKKWKNLCSDMELPVAQPLNEGNMARLRSAIGQEQDMEPLLKEYRRCVYQGDHRRCIELLRKIREQDPDNPSWKVNLKPLEEDELPELLFQAEKALKSNDLVVLKGVYDELTHPFRVVQPPEEQMKVIRKALLSERAAELKENGVKLLARIREAMAGMDCSAVESMLEKMADMEKSDAFLEAPQGWDNLRNEAREFLEGQKRRKDKQADFLKAIDDLQAMLSKGGFSEMALRHEWERLQTWELPVSDMLQRQVKETLEGMERAKKRNVRIFTITGISAAIVLIAVGGFFCLKAVDDKDRNARISYMQQLLDDEKYGEFSIYLEQLRRDKPVLAQSAKVEEMARKLQAFENEQKKAKSIFDENMERLSVIRSHQYEGADADAILEILKEAETAAKQLKNDNGILKIKSWRNSWEDAQGRKISQANTQLKTAVAAIQAAFDEQKQKPFSDFDAERDRLKQLRSIIAQAEPYIAFASEIERSAFLGAQERLATWERDFKERLDEYNEKSKELNDLAAVIPGSVMDLARYKQNINRYLSVAPQNDPMRINYQNFINLYPIYEGALLMDNSLNITLPMDKGTYKSLKQLSEKNAVGTIWERDLQKILDAHNGNAKLRSEVNALVSANPELLQLYYLKYRELGEEEWHRLYCPKMLLSGKDPENDDITIYWGNVYYTSEIDGIPLLMHTKNAFPQKLNSQDYEIAVAPKQQDNMCEYSKFVFKYIAESADAKDLPAYILDGIQKVFKDQKMEPVMRALLVKRFFAMLAETFGSAVPELVSLQNRFAQVNTDVPWMNPKHPDVVKAAAEFSKAVSECPNLSGLNEKMQRANRVLLVALNAKLRCVGSCIMDKNGSVSLDLRKSASRELWGIFRTASGAMPSFAVISDDGEKIMPSALEYVYPGMPVFSPATGHEALGRLKQMGISSEEVSRPASWPINAWK